MPSHDIIGHSNSVGIPQLDLPHGYCRYTTVYEWDGELFMACDVPYESGEGAKLVKVKPVLFEGTLCTELTKRYWLCICAAGTFPYALTGIPLRISNPASAWRPVSPGHLFEYGEEISVSDGLEYYIIEADPNSNDPFDRKVEELLASPYSSQALSSFLGDCDSEQSERAAKIAELLQHNINHQREKNYWKWSLYKNPCNPYNNLSNTKKENGGQHNV